MRDQCHAPKVTETFAVNVLREVKDSLPLSNQNLSVLTLLAQENTLSFLHKSKEGMGLPRSSCMEVNLTLGGQLTKADGETRLVKSFEVGRENL